MDPPGKFVILSKVEDVFLYHNKEFSLSTHQYLGSLHEGGYSFFDYFQLDPNPCFFYVCDDLLLKKEILMPQGKNAILIKYTIENKVDIKDNLILKIKPFIAYRNFHHLLKKNESYHVNIIPCKQGIQTAILNEMPSLYFQTTTTLECKTGEDWYFNFEYEQEKNRGFDYHEDLFMPFEATLNFNKEREVIFSCSLTELDNLPEEWDQEINLRKQNNVNISDKTQYKTLKKVLTKTANQFFVTKPENLYSVIAGFHWFLEWGRDALIALPGLTLYSGLEDRCLATLIYFSNHQHQGLIPNFIDSSTGKNYYDTVDASLWFCWAVQQYYLKTKDLKSIEATLWATLKNIFYYYQIGTLYDIKQGSNGLIYAGNPSSKITWMDVMIDNVPVTPRNGATVEINALWYNAICFMAELSKQLNDPILETLEPLIKQVKQTFNQLFWNESTGCLNDFVNDKEINAKIRPNQIMAVSLPFSPLELNEARKVVRVVQEHLLTPYGLRTLSPFDKKYKGYYKGGPVERDLAYHNGPVWPWLLGHFGEALIKTATHKEEVLTVLNPCIDALQEHVLNTAGLGSVSEIFDGNFPHLPNGCISQAWSVAELLRLIHLLDSYQQETKDT